MPEHVCGGFLSRFAEATYDVQGGAQNLERIPPPIGAAPGLPKFRASGQTIDKDNKVWTTSAVCNTLRLLELTGT